MRFHGRTPKYFGATPRHFPATPRFYEINPEWHGSNTTPEQSKKIKHLLIPLTPNLRPNSTRFPIPFGLWHLGRCGYRGSRV